MLQAGSMLCPGNVNDKFETSPTKIDERATKLPGFRVEEVSRSPTGALRDEVSCWMIRSSFELSVTYPAHELVKICHAQSYDENAVIASKIKATYWGLELNARL